jgi:hypothetical protein
MPSSGIETGTFRLTAQCLNQLRYRMPPILQECYKTTNITKTNFIDVVKWRPLKYKPNQTKAN